MERITVRVSVICPTHQQLIGYMEARHWHMVARRERSDGPTYSRWQKDDKHYFVDIHESPEFPLYYLSQKDSVILLADYDGWLDEYSFVQQLLRGGIMGQSDKTKVQFSDMGANDDLSAPSVEGKWQALDPKSRPV